MKPGTQRSKRRLGGWRDEGIKEVRSGARQREGGVGKGPERQEGETRRGRGTLRVGTETGDVPTVGEGSDRAEGMWSSGRRRGSRRQGADVGG